MKRGIFLTVVISIIAYTTVYAQSTVIPGVELTINSEDGVFAAGDTIIVRARVSNEYKGARNSATGAAEGLDLVIYEGGKQIYALTDTKPEKRSVSLTGEAQVIFSRSYADCAQVIIAIEDEKGTTSEVGFIVDPEKYRPGYEVPSDFRSYWRKQLKALRKDKPQVSLTPVEIPDPADAEKFEAYRIEISMPEGRPARGFIAYPRNASNRSLPIAYLVHAAGVSGDWCHAKLSNALQYAKFGNGAIGLDINAHGYEEGLPDEYYKDLENGELKGYSSRPLKDRESFYFRLMYLRDIRALDFACSLPQWDHKRVLVHGESQGGAQVEALAGLDRRVTAVVAIVPAFTDVNGLVWHHQGGWPSSYGPVVETELGKSILPYFDGALFLQFSNAKLFMVSGLIDSTCNPASVHAAFNAARSKDKQIYPFPYRWHSGTNSPFDKIWRETVYKSENAFVNDYLR